MTIFIPSHRIILNLLIAISVFFFLFLYSLSSSAFANDVVALVESGASEEIRTDTGSPILESSALAFDPYLSMPIGSTSDVLLGFGQFYVDPASGKSIKHSGIDIAAPSGTPVMAASSGRVSYIGRTVGTTDGDINCLTITDLSGNLITYRPIETDLVTGSAVEQGAVIGYLREVGDPSSMQPHLNLSVRDSAGRYIDPISLINLTPPKLPEREKPNLSEQAGSIKKQIQGIIPNKDATPRPDPITADQSIKINEALSDKTSAAVELLGQPQKISPPIEISVPQAQAAVLLRNKVGSLTGGDENAIAARKVDGAINKLHEARSTVQAATSSLPREHQQQMSQLQNVGYRKLRSDNIPNPAHSSKANYLNSTWPSNGYDVKQPKHKFAIWHTLTKTDTIIKSLVVVSMVLMYFSLSIFILKMRRPMRTPIVKQAFQLT